MTDGMCMRMGATASGLMRRILRKARIQKSGVALSSPSQGLRCSSNQQVAKLRFILRSLTEFLSIRTMKGWMPNSELLTISLFQTVPYRRFQMDHHRHLSLNNIPTQDPISASRLRLLLGHRILHHLLHQNLRHQSGQRRAQRRSDRPILIDVE